MRQTAKGRRPMVSSHVGKHAPYPYSAKSVVCGLELLQLPSVTSSPHRKVFHFSQTPLQLETYQLSQFAFSVSVVPLIHHFTTDSYQGQSETCSNAANLSGQRLDAIDVNMLGFVRTESKFIALVARRHVLTAVIFHVRSCSLKLAIHLITSSSHTGRIQNNTCCLKVHHNICA